MLSEAHCMSYPCTELLLLSFSFYGTFKTLYFNLIFI